VGRALLRAVEANRQPAHVARSVDRHPSISLGRSQRQVRGHVVQETGVGAMPAAARATADPTASPQLSIVMPVYNEAGVIADVLHDLATEIAGRLGDVELVLVDDASTDETPGILDRLSASDARLQVHH